MKGLVVFSYGLRNKEDEPNPCNIRLAKIAEQIIRGYDVVVVAQWEVARQLEKDDFHVDHVVHPTTGQYLDSEQVWEEAMEVFDTQRVSSEIIPVAQPFLQLTKVKKMITADGYHRIVPWKIGLFEVGFDRKSTQWWTRGPFRQLIYAVLQLPRVLWYVVRRHV